MDKEDVDLTTVSGGIGDVSPLGRQGQKPEHEKTAEEDKDLVNWPAVAKMPEFQALLRAKRRFIIPATLFFCVYYFALPVLVGYFPQYMDRPLIGTANIAYVFALSQFFMAWILAYLYVRKSLQFDRMAKDLVTKIIERKKGE